MTLDELEAVLKPFADFAAVFKHNLGGMPSAGENFYTKSFTVNGNETIAALNVDHFAAAEEAYAFVKGLPRPVVDKAEVGDKVEGEVRKAVPEDVLTTSAPQPMPEAEQNPAGT